MMLRIDPAHDKAPYLCGLAACGGGVIVSLIPDVVAINSINGEMPD